MWKRRLWQYNSMAKQTTSQTCSMFRYDALNIAGTRLIMSTLFRFNVHVFIAWIISFNLQWSVTSFQLSVTSYYFRLCVGQTCTSAMRKEKKQRRSFVLKWIINKRRLCAICNMQSALEIYVYYIFTTIFLEPIETTVKCLDDKTKQCVYMYVICGRQTNRRSRKKIISQKI